MIEYETVVSASTQDDAMTLLREWFSTHEGVQGLGDGDLLLDTLPWRSRKDKVAKSNPEIGDWNAQGPS